MTTITIEAFDTNRYHAWALNFVIRKLGSHHQVSRGVKYNVLSYPGYVAMINDEPQGILTYRIYERQCEVLVLASEAEGLGVGSALIEAVKQQAIKAGCERLWLITTNNNIHAFRWYQKRGFTIAAVHINALAESRKIKPEIPLMDGDGLPMRDEIEFELLLS